MKYNVPSHARSRSLQRALNAHRAGKLADAERYYRAILRIQPKHIDVLHLLGSVLAQRRAYKEADHLFRRALGIEPNSARALYNRGMLLQELGRYEEALTSYDRVLAINPNHLKALNNRGIVLQQLKCYDEALASYGTALAIKPDYPEALNNRGTVLQQVELYEEALTSYDRALATAPEYADALFNRGTVLQHLERYEEALKAYDKALAIKPDHVKTLNNRGIVLQQLARHGEALASYDEALAISPDHVKVLCNRGRVLQSLERHEEALASYDRALAIQPDSAEAFYSRGIVLQQLKRYRQALASYDKALQLRPTFAHALYSRADVLGYFKRYEEALACYDILLALEPDYPNALGRLADTALYACNWTRTVKLADELIGRVRNRTAIVSPVTLLCYDQDPMLQFDCATAFARKVTSVVPPPLWNGQIWHNGKIRIAYLSADFREHATAALIANLIEIHSRSRFEVLGFSFGPDDGSSMRARLVGAFDQFHDVRNVRDHQVAERLRELRVDIAVDLMGYYAGCRPGILAHRPASIQVNYLGYPGTMAVEWIDYIIADRIVLPFDKQPFYKEKIVHLPDCFQVNDSNRKISATTPTRREVGLPDQGFVFCCFNNSWKITPGIFEIWMRLLRSVEGSVLWLLRDNDTARMHLCREASARAVDPARLVFADRIDPDAHLARQRLADLFLDTTPINAGTTASDALWVGLPVLTCGCGPRIAASLLHAIGLPDMVANDLQDYERLALELARDPSRLLGIRRRLEQNRAKFPLFDTNRFRDHIEAAYTTMWELWQRGESPQSFSVGCCDVSDHGKSMFLGVRGTREENHRDRTGSA